MLLIVGQRIRAAWVIRSAQLDEDFHCRPIAYGFGFSDMDWLGIEIPRVDLATGIDSANLENITAIRSEPAPVQHIKIAVGSAQKRNSGSDPHHPHERDGDEKSASTVWLLGTPVGRPLFLLGLAHR